MKDIIKIGIALIIAFALHISLLRLSFPFLHYINIFSLVVVYAALSKGETYGMITGTLSGLLQDSFTISVFGINGFSKTALGFLIGALSRVVEVKQFIILFPLILVTILIELLITALLYYFTGVKGISLGGKILVLQPVVTALLGSLIFLFVFRMEKKWPK